ncbi:hypothetical protein M758_UG253800 [Ceratodon purpureus]|nr:hypothetical protein M758_UG253800 [Ceratodon purpureus]
MSIQRWCSFLPSVMFRGMRARSGTLAAGIE